MATSMPGLLLRHTHPPTTSIAPASCQGVQRGRTTSAVPPHPGHINVVPCAAVPRRLPRKLGKLRVTSDCTAIEEQTEMRNWQDNISKRSKRQQRACKHAISPLVLQDECNTAELSADNCTRNQNPKRAFAQSPTYRKSRANTHRGDEHFQPNATVACAPSVALHAVNNHHY